MMETTKWKCFGFAMLLNQRESTKNKVKYNTPPRGTSAKQRMDNYAFAALFLWQ